MLTAKIEGLRSVENGLYALKSSTAKSLTRRNMKKALTPMAEMAQGLAPVKTGELAQSIHVSSRIHRRHRGAQRDALEMYMGPGGGTKSITQEFGSEKNPPHPYMRPAWDAKKLSTFNEFARLMTHAVARALARHDAKMRRAAKK